MLPDSAKFLLVFLPALMLGCQSTTKPESAQAPITEVTVKPAVDPARFDIYAPFTLTSDLSHLSADQKQMIGLLIDAGRLMDELFWQQAYGDQQPLLASIDDPKARRFAEINYGPWDRLNANQPFIENVGPKPAGARFYPADMTKAEFEAADAEDKRGLYTLLRRDPDGNLISVPYHDAFAPQLQKASELLRQAADLAENPEFENYLRLRAEALVTDDYQPSDFAWMDMKTNPVEVVIGPIETYEDQLFGYKAAFSTYVLIKDQAWSDRLARFAAFLPELQKGLPVADRYKTEMPGTDSDLNAYDVVFYAGDSNAGSKTIAINLPNDEEVQLAKGTRRLQLKNAMRAKFDKILVPIADLLIAEDQQQHITFDAFFANTMFHEVAHGLGVKNTINGRGTVREALKETSSALEEGKADILGLYMITRLFEQDQITEGELMDNYVTFLAGIFRSVRFGATSAHGRANMVRFNFFEDMGAFNRDDATGRYRVDFERMQEAMNALSNRILTLQGDGDYAGAQQLLAEKGVTSEQLQADLERLSKASIPVDVTFRQGRDVLGL